MAANRNTTNIPVYMIKKDGTNQIIGKIIQQKTVSNVRYNTEHVFNTPIRSVNDFNMFILDYIKKDIVHPGANLAYIQTFNVFFIDDIIGIIYQKIGMKQGNIYFVFQKYGRSYHFLCYIVPFVKHSSNALESSFTYSMQDAKKEISKQLPVLLDKLGKFSSIYPFFVDLQNSAARFNVNRNFGI